MYRQTVYPIPARRRNCELWAGVELLRKFWGSAPDPGVLRFDAEMALGKQEAGSVGAPQPSRPPDRRSGRSPA